MASNCLPRNFKLLEELENDSKYNGISYGLKNPDDINLQNFSGMIIDQNANMSTFDIFCSNDYPKKPPTVKLMKTHNQKIYDLFGAKFDSPLPSSCEALKAWKETSCIADILVYIQKKA